MASKKKTSVPTMVTDEPIIQQAVEKAGHKFSKKQIVMSAKYANRRDLVDSLLEDKDYTIKEVDSLIDKYMKGKVK